MLQLGAVACVLAVLPYELFAAERYFFPKEFILYLAGSLALGLCLIGARRLSIGLVDACLAGFLVLGALSAVVAATNPWLALRALGLSLAGAAVFWAARALAGHGLAPQVTAGAAIAVVIAAAMALAEAYGLVARLSPMGQAPGGTIGNRNFMAHLLVVGLPVLLLHAVRAPGRRRFSLVAVGVAVVMAALILSRSRGAWLALLAMIAFALVAGYRLYPFVRGRVSARRVVALVLAGACGAAAALLLPNQLRWESPSPYVETLTGIANYRTGSGAERLLQYRNTLAMVRDHPGLGVGPGNWSVEYPRYASPGDPSYQAWEIQPTSRLPASDWVGLAAERGLPALLLLGLAAGVLVRRAWLRLSSSGEAGAGFALGATLVALAVVGTFDSVLLTPAPVLIAGMILGSLAPCGGELSLPLGARSRVLAGACVALLGLGLTLQSGLQIRAGQLYAVQWDLERLEAAARLDPGEYRLRILLARHWIARDRCDRALPHLEAASRLFPHTPAPRHFLAQCGVHSAPRTPHPALQVPATSPSSRAATA